MSRDKYVGMDVHPATIVVEVQDMKGGILSQSVMATQEETVKDFFRGQSGTVHVTLEEGGQSEWLYDIIKPLVAEVIVCEPRHNKLRQAGNKGDKVDAHRLAELLRLGSLKAVFHDNRGTRELKELVRIYSSLASDATRVMNRIKAVYRGRGVRCSGLAVYRYATREEWIDQVQGSAVRTRLELLYEQLKHLNGLRRQARLAMLKEARRHAAYRIIKQVPGLGPIRSAQIIAVTGTPHRFRTKKQYWPYGGLAVVTISSSDYEIVGGQMRRSKKPIGTRGLNRNYNRLLKRVFKGAAVTAISKEPFKTFYEQLTGSGMRPEMARLTVARKIAAITLRVWKQEEDFDATKLTKPAA